MQRVSFLAGCPVIESKMQKRVIYIVGDLIAHNFHYWRFVRFGNGQSVHLVISCSRNVGLPDSCIDEADLF